MQEKRDNVRHLGTKTIETKRLTLRRFTLDDAEKMYENWTSDDRVTKFLTWPTHQSVEVTKKVVTEWVSNYDKDDTNKYLWCIARKENDEPIGSIDAHIANEKAESFEVGYCISASCWHQGFTSEALQAVMDFLFDEVGANRVEARHDPVNSHSGEVMKKCGMHYEGTRKMADWNNTGICDEALYGKVKGDEKEITEQETTGNKTVSKECGDSTKHRKNIISDETIEYVGILAKLELNEEEAEQAKKDMGDMLDYIDKLNELDVTGVEPMSHIFPVHNVFREDVVNEHDGSKDTLANAPVQKDGGFKVPKTIGD